MSVISSTIKIVNGFSGPLSKLNSGLQQSQSRFSQFKAAMNGGSQFSGLNKSAEQTGGVFKSMLGANLIGAGITKGIGLASAGISSMVGELNESSTAWQTFNGNMGMLGKSPASIAKTRGGLQKFAQDTIYSASDMASTYSQLAAVGTKSTGKLVKGFGGLAAASSDPQQAMKTLSQQATQAAAKPKIQWADFKLMLEQTPAGMAMVAKTMHRNTGQLVKDVQGGKVKTEDFFNAIAKTGTNKQFSKMATQYKTVGQAMDGLKETVANNLQPAFDKVGKVGIKAISGLTDNIGNINFDGIADKITPMVTGVVNGLKTAGQAVGAFFKSFSNSGAITAVGQAFGSIKDTISGVVGKLSSMGSKDPFAAFKSLGSIAGGAITGAAKGIKAISDVIGDLDPGALKLLAGAFIALKAGTRGLIFTAVVAGLTALSKLNPGTLNMLAKGIGALAIGLVTIKTLGKIDGVLTGVGKAIKGLGSGGALEQAGASASVGAAGFIKLGVSLLLVGGAVLMAGAGLWLIANATTQLVSAGWPAVALFAAMVAGLIILAVVVATIGPAMIVGAVGFAIFGAALLLIGVAVFIAAAGITMLATQLPVIATYGVSAAVGLLALGAAMAVFGILAIVTSVGLILLGASLLIIGIGFTIAAVGMLMLAVEIPLIAMFSMVAAVGLLLMSTAMVIIAAVALIAGAGMLILAVGLVMVAPLSMIAAVGLLLLGAASMVLGAGLVVVGAGLMVAAAGMAAVASAVLMLAAAFVAAGSMMVSAIVGAMSRVVSAVSSGIQSAVSAARSFGSALVSVGRDLIQGLINGIKSMISAAVSAVTSVATSVVGKAKAILHIGSPSKLFKKFGAWTVEGLAIGINSNASMAANASAGMANGVYDAAMNVKAPTLAGVNIGGIGLTGTNPGDLLADGFSRALDVINSVASVITGFSRNSIGVTGQVNTMANGQNLLVDKNVPSSTPFGPVSGAGNMTNTVNDGDNSSSSVVVQVAAGAIQLVSSGDAQMDGEAIVRAAENYLRQVDAGSMS